LWDPPFISQLHRLEALAASVGEAAGSSLGEACRLHTLLLHLLLALLLQASPALATSACAWPVLAAISSARAVGWRRGEEGAPPGPGLASTSRVRLRVRVGGAGSSVERKESLASRPSSQAGGAWLPALPGALLLTPSAEGSTCREPSSSLPLVRERAGQKRRLSKMPRPTATRLTDTPHTLPSTMARSATLGESYTGRKIPETAFTVSTS
jgi:hypothetical protein